MVTGSHKLSVPLTPQDFPKIWEAERPLPRPELKFGDAWNSIAKGIASRFDFLEYLHTLKIEYAWNGVKCKAAQGYLDVLRGALKEADNWKRWGDRLWRGAVVVSGGLLAYAGLRATQDAPFSQKDWVALAAPAPLILGAGFARSLISLTHQEIAKDIQKLKNDIDWRCLPHSLFEQIVALADRTDSTAEGVNFTALHRHREQVWTLADKGIAEPSYTIDGIVIGVFGAAPLIRGAHLLWEGATTLLGPSALPIGGHVGEYLLSRGN